MGNAVVTPEMKITLTNLPANELKKLLEPDYTVLRSSGNEEAGWNISLTPHTYQKHLGSAVRCSSSEHDGNATRSIAGSKRDYGLRIFVSRSDTVHDESCSKRGRCHGDCAPCCGWRPCYPGRRNIWPTHLTTQEEKEQWWAWLDNIFSRLKSQEEIARSVDLRQEDPSSPEEACRLQEYYSRIADEASVSCEKEAKRLQHELSSVCQGCRSTAAARCPPCDAAFKASTAANERAVTAAKKAESLRSAWVIALAKATARASE